MKKLLNTLYITRQESYLHKERETIVIKQGNDKLGQFPALTVGNILCFGQVSVSPFLMGYWRARNRPGILYRIWPFSGTRAGQADRQCLVATRSIPMGR